MIKPYRYDKRKQWVVSLKMTGGYFLEYPCTKYLVIPTMEGVVIKEKNSRNTLMYPNHRIEQIEWLYRGKK